MNIFSCTVWNSCVWKALVQPPWACACALSGPGWQLRLLQVLVCAERASPWAREPSRSAPTWLLSPFALSYRASAGSRRRGEHGNTKQVIPGDLLQHAGSPPGNQQLEREGDASREKQGQWLGESPSHMALGHAESQTHPHARHPGESCAVGRFVCLQAAHGVTVLAGLLFTRCVFRAALSTEPSETMGMFCICSAQYGSH